MGLTSIDNWLIRNRYVYSRYVDDLILFFEDWHQLLAAIHDISAFLDESYLKLALNDSKTRTYTVSKYIDHEVFNPSQHFESLRSKVNKYDVKRTVTLVEIEDHYCSVELIPIQDVVLSEKSADSIFERAVIEMYEEAVESFAVDVRPLRYLISLLRKKTDPILVPFLIKDFSRLCSLIPEVVRYFCEVWKQTCNVHDDALISLLNSRGPATTPFARKWFAHFLVFSGFDKERAAIVLRSWSIVNTEYNAMAVYFAGELAEVRSCIERWQSYDDYCRPWIIISAARLPLFERKAKLGHVIAGGDIIDRAIAREALKTSQVT